MKEYFGLCVRVCVITLFFVIICVCDMYVRVCVCICVYMYVCMCMFFCDYLRGVNHFLEISYTLAGNPIVLSEIPEKFVEILLFQWKSRTPFW